MGVAILDEMLDHLREVHRLAFFQNLAALCKFRKLREPSLPCRPRRHKDHVIVARPRALHEEEVRLEPFGNEFARFILHWKNFLRLLAKELKPLPESLRAPGVLRHKKRPFWVERQNVRE